MYSVYQHWDPLQVCVVGRSYPPEFYSWIKVPHVRSLFERIAIETEEDYQAIIQKLESFGVQVLRPHLPNNAFIDGRYLPPPMTPRDHMIMIGKEFYTNYQFDIAEFYRNVKDPSWPACESLEDFRHLPQAIQTECHTVHGVGQYIDFYSGYDHIYDHIAQQGNAIYSTDISAAPGAYITRLGKDLYFGTESYDQDIKSYGRRINNLFTQTRNHVVNTGGHSDGTYCPVCPGLIISLQDVPTYQDTFPGWEVVYLPAQSWERITEFLTLKKRNRGRWWIPGFEHDQDVIDFVETWLGHWTGQVEETVFDVNMLMIDPTNVMVFNHHPKVFDALNRYGITPHVVPFRHRYLWDGGIHCVTTDLHRIGVLQDYFPQRG